MALYEGIALIQEKQAVVLDLGSEYTKFGFTGEAAPRCIIRSQFWDASERRYKNVFEYKTQQELYDNLVQMLLLLYFRHVLVNPKERKVVVVESLLTPTLLRETLAQVLFMHFEVSGVVWADSARLVASSLGAAVALVVELGARDVEVTAVVHGIPILRALQSQPLGAARMRAALARMLREDNNDPELKLTEQELEDIIVKTCFIAPLSRASLWSSASPPTPARDVMFPRAGGGGSVRVAGRSRERAGEVMFERDGEMASLPDVILQCIMQSPVDARRHLADNVCVCGGASPPGLRARLQGELLDLVQTPHYSNLHIRTFKFHNVTKSGARPNTLAWCGGALLGGAGGRGGLAREQWAARGAAGGGTGVPDWVCLLDNTPPTHYHRLEMEKQM